MTGNVPLVSVVTATYNRSNALAFSIKSVLRQTFEDWELWVIGDACTDDTEEIVSSFADPRIHFVNLPENIGEQSGPNNEGFDYARGRYIAYLNHDDLWLEDHLEICVGEIENTGADVISGLIAAILPDRRQCRLSGVVPETGYAPHMDTRASSWLIRRETIEDVGPWRYYREIFDIPSHNWIYRAWKAGKTIRSAPKLTVIVFGTGARPGVYAKRECREQQDYYQRLVNDPNFREQELLQIAVNSEIHIHDLKILPLVCRIMTNIVWRGCNLLGISPAAVSFLVHHHRKGGAIDSLRAYRGLPALSRRKQGADHGKVLDD